jgi:hypothetical protein
MVASIVAIVYSPFVDLPLTESRAGHAPAHLHALPAVAVIVAEPVALYVVSHPAQRFTAAADVFAITCSYLC